MSEPSPDELRRYDQTSALMADLLPPVWRRLFDNLTGLGFTEDQALSLVRTFVHGAAGGRFTER